jgi:ribosomal protein S27AE
MDTHCCEMMQSNVDRTCADHPSRYDCPDCLIEYWSAAKKYGLIVHDGGKSIVQIDFCPWCGSGLSGG